MPYPHLFSEWQIRNTTIPNRVVFAPTCPTWVANPYEGVFTDQAVAYYEERAKGGCGLIIIGGTVIHPSAHVLAVPLPRALGRPADRRARRRSPRRCTGTAASSPCQLLHVGLRASAVLEDRPGVRLRREVVHGRAEPGAARRVPERADAEGARGARDRGDPRLVRVGGAARDRRRASTASSSTCRTATCPGSSSRRSTTTGTDRWGGSYENRLRFPVEAMTRIRAAIGDEPFIGYRINSTSFWPGDLELEDIQRIVGDLERECDVDFVDLSAGVHHSYIHTPMTYEDGWEREYTRAVKTVSTKPVLLVGRITKPEVAEELLESGDADAILLARQMFADAEWAQKAREGKEDDIRRCVAANYCWRSRDPRRARAVHLQPRGRTRAAVGRRDARPGGGREARARRRRRAGRARVRAHRRRARPRGRRARARGRGRRARALVLEAPGPCAVLRDRGMARQAGARERRGDPRRDRGERGRRRGLRPRGRRHGRPLLGGRLPGPDGRTAARLGPAAASRGTRSRSGRSRPAATSS